MNTKGIFVISLDFELYWGVHDRFSLEHYKKHLLGARKVIPILLERFKQYNIHATWATVGLLFFSNKEELLKEIPSIKPNYHNNRLSPYNNLKDIGETELADPFHYGSSLINAIRNYENQEIATHTFSHYYCLATGQSIEAFQADVHQAIQVAKNNHNLSINSIVFPRNQVNPSYLTICKKFGLSSYRGCENHWLYRVTSEKIGMIKRVFRLLDSYLNISGHHIYAPTELTTNHSLVNIPSSRFLRPYSKTLHFLEALKLRRIKNSMTKAAKNGKIFHLWWHPHNFGTEMEKNIQTLDLILEHYNFLNQQYGMESLTMQAITNRHKTSK